MTKKTPAPSDRARLRRRPDRGHYDRATIDAILDAQPVAHVGYAFKGAPIVTPTLHWREGDRLYWHGSAASRMIKHCAGKPVCVTVTLHDAMVLARSAFNHTVNYRSVMLFGKAKLEIDPEAKEARLRAMMEGLFPGRWDQLRPVTKKELRATTVLSIAIDEASAKIRSGPPKDDEADYAQDVWAGEIPLRVVAGAPLDAPRLKAGTPLPEMSGGSRSGEFGGRGRRAWWSRGGSNP
ncbi:MAG: pyridoxamine 5'-phosphate oxidase family protein [Alphaproteobacteria bacterium]|nr:pyridoxamine 5'-phosphate oxidase family protein [Alphaproteobacteria bacterium]